MSHEKPPSQEGSAAEQHGFSQREVDRMYEEAFREAFEMSDIRYELPHVISQLLDEAGYRLERSDEARGARARRDYFRAKLRSEGLQ